MAFNLAYFMLLSNDPFHNSRLMSMAHSNLSVIPIKTVKQLMTARNLSRFYCYEMWPYFTEYELPEDGMMEPVDYIDDYLSDPTRFGYLLNVDQKLAGFALINKVGTTPDVDWNMAEFFIAKIFQGQGFGKGAVKDLLARHPGVWEVHQIPTNMPALAFWRKVLKDRVYEERIVTIPEPVPHEMNVMRFEVG